jgi:hypothetical protein
MERPEHRVAKNSKQAVGERTARQSAAVTARVTTLARKRSSDDEGEKYESVADERDGHPRSNDESKDTHRAMAELHRKGLPRLSHHPGLRKSGRKYVNELAVTRDTKLASILRGEPFESALSIPKGKPRSRRRIGHSKRHLGIDARLDDSSGGFGR